jgi:anti-sigma-K factor RskA
MNHEAMDLHAAAYALGALDGEELLEFERHRAAGCDRCETFLRDSREALVSLEDSAPLPAPPPSVKEALMRRAAMEGRTRRQPARRAWLPWMITTAAAMAVAALASGLYVSSRYEARVERLARDASSSAQLAALLREPGTRLVTLQGTGPAPQAHGRVVWHDVAGGQLVVAGLPRVPEGKAYELWAFRSGTPRPAGVFHVDHAGHAAVPVAAAGGAVEGFAISVEPVGGVPAPTGPVVLASAR